ncbi:hypothetical protein [Clostridium sp. C2-6-12]|uniref:hypothetical protein n=1 Tax=Clostridium sp. C2-6-12 TaxID=2698832 RepID=UPI00136F4B38|nr:hypothetical protein [Clostridium sp. C2-6-12]
MGKKKFSIIIFLLSFVSLIISLKLFLNSAIFADEYNTSPAIINGGEFWLTMDWLRLLFLLLLCILSVITIFKGEKKK